MIKKTELHQFSFNARTIPALSVVEEALLTVDGIRRIYLHSAIDGIWVFGTVDPEDVVEALYRNGYSVTYIG